MEPFSPGDAGSTESVFAPGWYQIVFDTNAVSANGGVLNLTLSFPSE